MYYTKSLTIILLLLATGCSTSPSNLNSKESINISNAEISLYREAITALGNNHLDKAKTGFLKMSEAKPGLAGPWANLALIYIKQQQYKKADNAVKRALENNPEMPQALNLAGVIAEQEGRIADARELYEKALTNKPDYAIAHYNLALLFDVYLQNISKALLHYQQYMIFSGGNDKNTALWIKELTFNLENSDS